MWRTLLNPDLLGEPNVVPTVPRPHHHLPCTSEGGGGERRSSNAQLPEIYPSPARTLEGGRG